MAVRVLIDILHPAHVHHYRHLAAKVIEEGGAVLFTARRKDVTIALLEAYNLPFEILSSRAQGALGLGLELATRVAKLIPIARRFRPDLMLGIMGPVIAPVGKLLGIPTIVSYDTEEATVTNRWVFPLATRVLVPECWIGPRTTNMVTYPGLQELAYLHPDRFTPDAETVRASGIDPNTPYIVVRLASLIASHDIDTHATGVSNVEALVSALEKHAKVIFTGEAGIPSSLQGRVCTVPPEHLHHVMAFASLVIGDGITTCVEAGVLGVPAIIVHSWRLGYMVEMEERWQLIANRDHLEQALEVADQWLNMETRERRTLWQHRRQQLLAHRHDTTEILWTHVHELAKGKQP